VLGKIPCERLRAKEEEKRIPPWDGIGGGVAYALTGTKLLIRLTVWTKPENRGRNRWGVHREKDIISTEGETEGKKKARGMAY